MKLFYLFLGGGIGTLARYLVSGYTHHLYHGSFPLGTLLVNIAGSFLIGLIWGLWENSSLAPVVKTFLLVGLLGGFTTFSTYSLETLHLFKEGETRTALLNIAANNLLALIFVFTGYAGARGLQGILK